jgi:hypothetical protein
MTAPVCATPCGSGPRDVPSVAQLVGPQFLVQTATSQVTVDQEAFEVGPAITADEANSRLVINEQGIYEISVTEEWTTETTPVVFILFVDVDGTTQFISQLSEPLLFKSSTLSFYLQMTPGQVITLRARFQGVTAEDVILVASLGAEKIA